MIIASSRQEKSAPHPSSITWYSRFGSAISRRCQRPSSIVRHIRHVRQSPLPTPSSTTWYPRQVARSVAIARAQARSRGTRARLRDQPGLHAHKCNRPTRPTCPTRPRHPPTSIASPRKHARLYACVTVFDCLGVTYGRPAWYALRLNVEMSRSLYAPSNLNIASGRAEAGRLKPPCTGSARWSRAANLRGWVAAGQ